MPMGSGLLCNKGKLRSFLDNRKAHPPIDSFLRFFKRLEDENSPLIAEVGLTSYHVHNYIEDKNEEAMHLQLDLVDKDRATAKQRLARYQNLMSKHYNAKVRHIDFQIGDLVLRKVMGTAKDPS